MNVQCPFCGISWNAPGVPLMCLSEKFGGCNKSFYDDDEGHDEYGCQMCETSFHFALRLPDGTTLPCSKDLGGCGRPDSAILIRIGGISKRDLDRAIIQGKAPPAIREQYYYIRDGRPYFNASRLAKEIMQRNIIKTVRDNREMYYYQDGIFNPNAEVLIKEQAKSLAGDDLTSHQANEVIFHIETSTYIDRKELESPINLVHLDNGVLNLDTGKLLHHSPDLPSLSKLPVSYDEKAVCLAIMKFMSEILDHDDINTVQELAGYLLLRIYCYRKAFMLVGDGSNGKTTFLNLLAAFVGNDNTTNKSLQALMSHRFAPGQLFGKLLNFFADLTDEELSRTGQFKALCGYDWIDGEHKFKDSFRFMNYAKLIFSCNKMPVANDDTDAYFDRWVIIIFTRIFAANDPKTDKNIIDKLTTQSELSGFLNWAIEGLNRLKKNNGNFTTAKSVLDNKAQIELLADPLSAFIHKFCKNDPTVKTPKADFNRELARFCEIWKLIRPSDKAVGSRMTSIIPGVQSIRAGPEGKRYTAWEGLKLLIFEEYCISIDCDVKDVKDVKVLQYFKRVGAGSGNKVGKTPDIPDNPDTTGGKQTRLDDQDGAPRKSNGGEAP